MLDMLRYARYLVRRPMAYRVKINNVQIEADTLAEVLELLRQSPPIALDGKLQLPSLGWTTHSVARLLNLIQAQEKQLFVLYELQSYAPEGLLKEELIKHQEMSAQQLGGVLSGLAKNAKKLNCTPPIEIEHTVRNGQKTCRYSLCHEFVEAWAQLEIDLKNETGPLLHSIHHPRTKRKSE